MLTDILKNSVLKPLLMRLGTMLATALIVGGQWLCEHWSACGLVTEGGAQLVVTYVTAVALLIFDLVVEALAKAKR